MFAIRTFFEITLLVRNKVRIGVKKYVLASVLVISGMWFFSILGWIYFVGDHFMIGVAGSTLDISVVIGDSRNPVFKRLGPDPFDPSIFFRPSLMTNSNKRPHGVLLGGYPQSAILRDLLGLRLPYWDVKKNNGFTWAGRGWGPAAIYECQIPLWIPFILVVALWRMTPVLFKPPLPTCCRSCSYDLRALAGQVCPECGTHVALEQIEEIRRSATATLSAGNADAASSNKTV